MKVIIAVNISTKNLFHREFIPSIKKWLKHYRVDPKYLELEITESALMHNPQASEKALQELHEYGITLAIDDFGTGYSSLAYLKRFPIHKLKIDRTFINDLESVNSSKILVETALSLSNNLNYISVAEGVETKNQLDLLHQLGCQYGQGFYWSKPIPYQEMLTLLTSKAEII